MNQVHRATGPRAKAVPGGGLHVAVSDAEELTAVMVRLASLDLETLDSLVKTGCAGSRAQAIRWALARIRERPAYQQLQEQVRQIEQLKTQF